MECYAAPVVEPPQAEEAPQDEHSTESLPHAPTQSMLEATSTISPPAPTAPTTVPVPESTSLHLLFHQLHLLIGALHDHICHRVLCHGTFVPDTDYYT